MFVGHAALAFALTALGARALGVRREQALAVGVVAALAATIPDLDMLSVLPGLLSGVEGTLGPVERFWAGAAAHRSVTHSLVLAVPVGAVVGLVAESGRRRVIGLSVAGLLATGLLALPAAGAAIVLPFVGGAIGLGLLASRLPVSARATWIAASVGLLTHPFGDLFTGEPPWLLYPFGLEVLPGRMLLSADPTLHLLGAFFVELGAIWLGVYALLRLRGETLGAHVRPRAALGGLFAGAAVLIPAPTLAESYQFVFGVLAVGTVGLSPSLRRPPIEWVVTGLAAITLGGLGYAITYLLGVA
jgi:membrane-bound metal-dependent hydrolase YbcI (DUF457 family)